MKKILLNGFLFSLSFGLGLILIGFIAYKVYGALSTTTNGSPLTATNWNDIINKVNSLESTITTQASTISSLQTTVTSQATTITNLQNQINSIKQVDVPTSDTAFFDLNCERRFYSNGSYFLISHIRGDRTQIFWSQSDFKKRRMIKYNDKTNAYGRDVGLTPATPIATITKLQKKCQS